MKFKPGDIITKAGALFPVAALSVIEHTDNELKAADYGGGSVYSFSPSSQEKYCFRLVTEAELSTPMHKADFQIEDDPIFPGWTDGTRWNGWQKPGFEFETAKQVAAFYGMTYNPGRDCFVRTTPDYDDELAPVTVNTKEGLKKIYQTDGWIWSLAETQTEGGEQ